VTRPRVLLADDHAFLRAAMTKLLTPECDVIGQVADGGSLVAAAELLKPDVLVVDISMPILNGFEAWRKIKGRLPGVKLVFLTLHDDDDLAAEAFRVGASAYVIKGRAASDLRMAIREVSQGRTFVTSPLWVERD
jgi:DNA-binding NarL/FixJ family response regulator